MVDEQFKEDTVEEQQSSNLVPHEPKQQNDSDNSDEEAEVEHPDLEAADPVQEQQTSALSENLNATEQQFDTNGMTDARNTHQQQTEDLNGETYSSDTQSSSIKASNLAASDDHPRTQESLEADIVRDEREQALDADKEHDVNKKPIESLDKEHEKAEQTRAKEHDLGSLSESEEVRSSDVRPNEQLASSRPLSDDVQKHAIQDNSQGQRSSDLSADEHQQQESAAKHDAGNVERAKSSENDPTPVPSGFTISPLKADPLVTCACCTTAFADR